MEKEKSNEINVIVQILSYENRKFESIFDRLTVLIQHVTTVQLTLIENLIKQVDENKMNILSDPLFKEHVAKVLEQMQRNLERQMESPTMQTARLTHPPQPADPLKQESKAVDMLCPQCFKKIFISRDAKKVICPYCEVVLEAVADDEGRERLEKKEAKKNE